MGATHGNTLLTEGRASDFSPTGLTVVGGEHIPSAGVSLVQPTTLFPVFWAGVLGVGVGLGSGQCDVRKGLWRRGTQEHWEEVSLWLSTLPHVEMMPGTGTVTW